jgi:hypothetical protein
MHVRKNKCNIFDKYVNKILELIAGIAAGWKRVGTKDISNITKVYDRYWYTVYYLYEGIKKIKS